MFKFLFIGANINDLLSILIDICCEIKAIVSFVEAVGVVKTILEVIGDIDGLITMY